MTATAQILNGRALAEKIKTRIANTILQRSQQGFIKPGLAVILVGDDAASAVYVNHKNRACEQVGIHSIVHRLPETTSQSQLIALIEQLNQDPEIHGILLQLPVPQHLDSNQPLELIRPEKDIDGLHPYNLGRLAQRRPLLRPCTPYGIIKLLQETHVNLAGKHAVVVGASNIVGRPMALELLLAKCTVTICHSQTVNLIEHVKMADILIAAVGKRNIIDSEWIKPGAIVIDAGIHRLDNGKIVGDLLFETAQEKASFITPVPGGVGPMTVATLLENTLQASIQTTSHQKIPQ